MSENKEKPKRLMEPFLIKMAARDKALVGKTKEKKFKADTTLPSTSRKLSEPSTEGINSNSKNQNQIIVPPLQYTSFPQFNPSLQIQMQTNIKQELKATQTAMLGVPSTSTTMSLLSEASVKSSISSMKSIVKSFFKVEENNPSFYQKLVIPFSGFTESDVKEIRGGREPKSTHSRQTLPRTSGNDPRPVLKRYQSEKRKSSYDRYVQESLENFLQARSNTEDSSYNTVIAVKMMVDNASKVEERVDNFIIDEPNENTSKDTIFLPNSELLSARLERILNPASIEVSFNEHTDQVSETPSSNSIPISDGAKFRSKLTEMRKELEQFDRVYDRMHGEYEEAEKVYFTAKVNFYRIKMKRDMLISQIINLEKELTPGKG